MNTDTLAPLFFQEAPMNTLYIDIDDTLVTWLSEEDGPHPYGVGA